MDKLIVKAIIETLGTPKDYVETTIKNYIEKLKKDKINITKEEHHEAIPTENLYSTYVEIEVEFKKIEELLNFCFDAMPSSIEIVHPEEIIAPSTQLNSFLNDLQAKIHDNDLLIKGYKAKTDILDKNTIAIFENFIKYILKQEPKSLNEISPLIGVKPEELKPFLQGLIDKNKIKIENEKYKIQ